MFTEVGFYFGRSAWGLDCFIGAWFYLRGPQHMEHHLFVKTLFSTAELLDPQSHDAYFVPTKKGAMSALSAALSSAPPKRNPRLRRRSPWPKRHKTRTNL